MLLCGQSNRIWHYWAGRYPGSVGLLVSPNYWRKVPLDRWMPFALDNGAFTAWRDKTAWDVDGWRTMLRTIKLRHLTPLWAAVPDVVADAEATIRNWYIYAQEIHKLGWPAAFCLQDGMTVKDVPRDAQIVFVGGTDRWKFPNLEMWTRNFPHVHCARVTSQEMIESCERLGCQSIDGTGWFMSPDRKDHLPMLQNFIEGHREMTPGLAL